MNPISLAHLTVLDLAPPRMIHAAAEIGFDSVGLRLIRVTETTPGYPLMDDPPGLREARRALDETGLRVLDIEFVRMTPEFRPERLASFLDAGAALEARYVICAPYDPDLTRLADNLAALSEQARSRRLTCVLEFFPWTNVPDLAAANRVVEATRDETVGILVDTLHFDRSGSSLDDLSAIGPRRLPFAHLSDAPVIPPYTTEQLLHAGRAERLPPGEGDIDLGSILDRLPPDIPLALEVPMMSLQRAEGSEAVARRAFAATRRILASRTSPRTP